MRGVYSYIIVDQPSLVNVANNDDYELAALLKMTSLLIIFVMNSLLIMNDIELIILLNMIF